MRPLVSVLLLVTLESLVAGGSAVFRQPDTDAEGGSNVDASETGLEGLEAALGEVGREATAVVEDVGAALGVASEDATEAPPSAPPSKVASRAHGLDKVFCRGGACQYRAAAIASGLGVGPGMPALWAGPSQRTFCRGLACPPKKAVGQVAAATELRRARCVKLLLMGGAAETRLNVTGARDGFEEACRLRVGEHDADYCPDSADVFVAALAPVAAWPEVPGGAAGACAATLRFADVAEQAEIGLGMGSALDASQKGSLSMPRGRHWQAWTNSRASHAGAPAPAPAIAPVVQEANATAAAQGPTSPPGIPIEHFTSCLSRIREVTLNQARAAPTIVQMMESWCSWQRSSATVGSEAVEQRSGGHPEWGPKECTGMATFVAFALRDDLPSELPLEATLVCERLFQAGGAVRRLGLLMAGAMGPRPLRSGVAPNDQRAKRAEEAARRADEGRAWLRARREAHHAVESAKAAVDSQSLRGGIGFKPSPTERRSLLLASATRAPLGSE
mmetsp:Transcript_134548/g.287870  ORF Transcript_134548/g.287870 Transcript_134548/m.287870 type:complete len:504 (-) Transcript_134548:61-1572(-)